MKKDRRSMLVTAIAFLLLLLVLFCVLIFRETRSDAFVGVAQIAATAGAFALFVLVAILQSRSAKRSQQERMQAQESEERLRLVMHNMTATIWDYDLRTRSIIQTSDSIRQHGFERVVSNVPDSLIECGFVHPDSAEEFRTMYERLFAGEPRAEGLFRVRTADRQGWWYEYIQYVNLFDTNGRPYRAIGMSQDETDRQELINAAQTDSLTGLLNHNATTERIRRLLAEKDASGVSALMIIDLDNFKLVNDKLGHQTGDETLVKIAGIIRESFRSEDVVGRIGGDEFMVFLCHAPNVQIIQKKAYQLVQALQVYCGDAQNDLTVSASIGAAICRSGDEFNTLYKRADVALYAAKEAGRNRYRIDAGDVQPEPGDADEQEEDSLSPIQLQSLLENIDGGVILFEMDDMPEIRYVSPSFFKFSNLPKSSETLSGQSLLDMVDPTYRDKLLDCLRQGVKDYSPVDFSYQALTKAGKRVWQHIRAVRIHNGEFSVPMMIAVITDISEIKKSNAMLDAIVENSPLGIGVFNVATGFQPVFVNSVLLKMFQFTREEFFDRAGGNALGMVEQGDLPMVRELIQKVAQSNKPEEVIYHPAAREGMARRSIRANGMKIPGKVGETLLLIMFNDITGQEQEMRMYAGDIVVPQPNTKRKVLIVDDNIVNRQILRRILSDDYDVIEAENGQIALEILEQANESVSAVLLDIVMPVMDGFEVLERLRADSNLTRLPVIVTTGNTEEGTEVRALSLGANDFIAKPYNPMVIRHRLENTINLRETAAFVNSVEKDELTGVYSKEFFYRKAASILHANPNERYDIVCSDIERFKLINELYGEQTADRLLRYVADTLVQSMRGRGACGRIGADKFACLIPHRAAYTDEEFDTVIQQINQFPISLSIDVSSGIFEITDETLPVSTMCDRALTACNSVKGRYGVHFAYYDDTFRERTMQEQTIVDSMKRGLSEQQFLVYYQPKYSLKTGALAGAEALVRWQHPEKGLLMPGQFVPLFERNGFITDLDRYVWEAACRDLADWIARGRTAVPVSVNVSRTDVYNPNLPDLLLDILKKYGIEPRMLHLEITESAYTEDSDQLIRAVMKLKELGFLIEMDDFGTGYSSLNMLAELPINILKLDMGFVRNEDANPKKESILEAVVLLAQQLRLPVIAEGVETEEQAEKLRSFGCNYAQGYYYAKPMPRDIFGVHIQNAQTEEIK